MARPMICRMCGKAINSKVGDHPTLGWSCQLDEDGKEIPGSKQEIGIFHPACWEQVKRVLSSAPPQPGG